MTTRPYILAENKWKTVKEASFQVLIELEIREVYPGIKWNDRNSI